MTIKQICTLHYILGRLEGIAEGLGEQNHQDQQQYLLDTCELLDGLLREESDDLPELR